MSRYTKHWHTLCLIFTFLISVFTGGCVEEKTQNDADNVVEQSENNPSVQGEGDGIIAASDKGYIDPAQYPELYNLALNYYKSTDDDSILDGITTVNDWNIIIQYVYQIEQEDESTPSYAWGLPDCGYLYGSYAFSGWANYPTFTNQRHLWWPNCTITDTWTHCGPDRDNLVSFWTDDSWSGENWVYRVTSTSATVRAWLFAKQQQHVLFGTRAGNYRMHLSGPYGNAYFCLPSAYNASTLRFGRP